MTWHRAIVAEGNPSTIVAVTAFHKLSSGWVSVGPPHHQHQESFAPETSYISNRQFNIAAHYSLIAHLQAQGSWVKPSVC